MLYVKVVLFLLVLRAKVEPSSPKCDSWVTAASREGNLGETALFPWLGVLRVHLHQEKSLQIALTGIVLVKEGFAIANADDVARIPKRTFHEDSKAMFIPQAGEPWYCRLKDFMTHPEYEYATLNTIALLQLDPGDNYLPMRPICWPPSSFNASDQLYAVGFTDENQLLEKSVYKLQHVEFQLCKEFYNRAGLTEGNLVPVHYQCGFAASNRDNCVWDNGMALVSNSSGYWTLLGIGVRGPGCAAPARFIDLSPYYPWIEGATDVKEFDDYDFRRWTFGKGFKKKLSKPKPEIEDIPVHELLRPELGRARDPHFIDHYPFPTGGGDTFDFDIHRVNQSAINLQRLDGEAGDCYSTSNKLIYYDSFRIKTKTYPFKPPMQGSVVYKLSLYDLHHLNYSCVKLKVNSLYPETAYLFYKTSVDAASVFTQTPDELIQTYPIVPALKDKDDKSPFLQMKLKPIEDKTYNINVTNINIYLKVEFLQTAWFKIEIYGPLPSREERKKNQRLNSSRRFGKKKLNRTRDFMLHLKKDVTVVNVSYSSANLRECSYASLIVYCLLLLGKIAGGSY